MLLPFFSPNFPSFLSLTSIIPSLIPPFLYLTSQDSFPVEAATARGIRVATLPMHIDIAVAEHALALMLGLARRITEADKAVRPKRSTVRSAWC